MKSVSQPSTANVSVGFRGRVKNFWRQVSEGRQIDDLWKQFAADARAGYGFYGRDVDWEWIHKLPRWRRPLHVGKQLFWVLLVKLTPVRRVLLLMALVLLVLTHWLVPAHPPEVPGADIAFATRTQNSVAGDYYDAFFLNPDEAGGKLMVVIADVVGKSIPAALLMATLQASLRTIAGEGAPLVDLVARLNRYACAHSQGGQRFTTAVLSEYA